MQLFCQRRLCWLRTQFRWRKKSAEKWLWHVLPSLPACQWLLFHCSFTPGYVSTGAKDSMIPQLYVYICTYKWLSVGKWVSKAIILYTVSSNSGHKLFFRGKMACFWIHMLLRKEDRQTGCPLPLTCYNVQIFTSTRKKKPQTCSWVSLNPHCKCNLLLCLRKAERMWKLWRGKVRRWKLCESQAQIFSSL